MVSRVTKLRLTILLLLMFSADVFSQDNSTSSCPHGGVSFEGRCFWFSVKRLMWSDASIICSRLFGDHVTLATIKDEATNRFIRSQSNATLWIGLHEAHGETEWRWLDHTSPSNGNYKNWDSSIDYSTSTKHCAVMYEGTNLWRDANCNTQYTFVCNELPSAPLCSKGGIYFRDRCYWITNETLSFNNATNFCQSTYGEEVGIAVANDAKVNMFLSRLIYPSIWIGLTDTLVEGRWRWIDNASLTNRFWRDRQPDNWRTGEDCAMLFYDDAKWNDISCYARLRFICSIPPCYDLGRLPSKAKRSQYILPEFGYPFMHDIFEYDSNYGSSEDEEEEEEEEDVIVCVPKNCEKFCVSGGVCKKPSGECDCVKQFPEMVCDTADWRIGIESTYANTTNGGNFTLKCMINLPVDHVVDLSWIKIGGELSENRTTITKVLHKGYSLLKVTNVEPADAAVYICIVTLSLGKERGEIIETVYNTTVVAVFTNESSHHEEEDISELPTTAVFTNESSHHEEEDISELQTIAATIYYQRSGGATAAIITLSILVVLMSIALIGVGVTGRCVKVSFGTSRLAKYYYRSGETDCEQILHQRCNDETSHTNE